MEVSESYEAWASEAFDELLVKQSRMHVDFRMETWPRYAYDLEAGTLTFADETGPKVVAEIHVAGTTSKDGWLWGWANTHLPEKVTKALQEVKALGEAEAAVELTTAEQKDDDPDMLGWEMTAIAVKVLAAAGAYRPAPQENGSIFFVCQSLRFVS